MRLQYIDQLQVALIRVDHCGYQISDALLLLEKWNSMERSKDAYYFFKGEQSFLNKKYLNALSNFLNIEDLFFKKLMSYRAAAYLSEERGLIDKSCNYLISVLSLQENDYVSLKLLHHILLKRSEYENAKEVKDRLDRLISLHLPLEKQVKSFSISNQEITELKQIFHSSSLSSQLFENETDSICL